MNTTNTTTIDRRGLPSPLQVTIGLATVLVGLIAGFFYAYACSVMIGLERTDDQTFVSTMQNINATVRNGWFAPSFFGSLIAPAVVVVWSLVLKDRKVLLWSSVALGCYGAAFLITMAISVPLNNELADAGDPGAIANLHQVRSDYEDPWVRWNIVRTIASIASLIALIRCLIVSTVTGDRSPSARDSGGSR